MVLALFCSLFSSPALAGDVTLKAEDGTRIHAVYTEAREPVSGVVLVHMVSRSASDYRFLADKLQAQGISAVAVDLRKHGDNVDEGEEVVIEDIEWSYMKQDVAAGVAYLRAQGVDDIAIVGASIGANLALNVAAEDEGITNVVLLSPGMEYKGVELAQALGEYGERPLLCVVSQDDRYSAKTGLFVEAQARGYHKLEIYETAGHGTRMLNKAPALEPLLVSWLLGSYRLSDTANDRSEGLTTGDTTKVETEGTRINE
ncbi:MAG TPA: alpha/beta fold hydrolase [Myxococcota bacterium]|nr:alpha/beta fold hydrolase [Myxococcota bacterium]